MLRYSWYYSYKVEYTFDFHNFGVLTLNTFAMKKILENKPLILFVFLVLLMTACAPGNAVFDTTPASFLMGLWHGFIALFTFIISLFNDKVTMYEVNNVGKLYNLGFLIGVMMFWGGGTKSTCRRRR